MGSAPATAEPEADAEAIVCSEAVRHQEGDGLVFQGTCPDTGPPDIAHSADAQVAVAEAMALPVGIDEPPPAGGGTPPGTPPPAFHPEAAAAAGIAAQDTEAGSWAAEIQARYRRTFAFERAVDPELAVKHEREYAQRHVNALASAIAMRPSGASSSSAAFASVFGTVFNDQTLVSGTAFIDPLVVALQTPKLHLRDIVIASHSLIH